MDSGEVPKKNAGAEATPAIRLIAFRRFIEFSMMIASRVPVFECHLFSQTVADLIELVQAHCSHKAVNKRMTSQQLRRPGEHNLPHTDCFSAALAQSKEATLVTSDKDFGRVGTALKILWV